MLSDSNNTLNVLRDAFQIFIKEENVPKIVSATVVSYAAPFATVQLVGSNETIILRNLSGQILSANQIVEITVKNGSYSNAFISSSRSAIDGGGGTQGTTDYGALSNKPTLDTTNTTSLATNTSETIQGEIHLHKIAKTGSYADLLNKPTIPTTTSGLTNNSNFVSDASYIHTDNNYTSAEKTKLSNIAADAEVNVQSDWNAANGDAAILNKPSLGTAASKNTGTSSGQIPVLDTNGKLESSVFPSIVLTDTFVIASEAEMIALSTAGVGDIAIRTDIKKSFILKTTPYSVLANWQELLTPADSVLSVNSKTGVVSLSASDVGATPSSHIGTGGSEHAIATGATNGFMSSTDKTKLDGVATGANNYTHPATHPPSIIAQDSTNRFTTDVEKSTWNSKADTTVATTSVNGLMSSTDKIKLNGITAGAEVNQNAFSSIAVQDETTVVSTLESDTVTFIAGDGITMSTDSANKTITVNASVTPYADSIQYNSGISGLPVSNVQDAIDYLASQSNAWSRSFLLMGV